MRHGHSTMWKTGAIITFASIGVSLAGDAGVFVFGPAVWIEGIHRSPE